MQEFTIFLNNEFCSGEILNELQFERLSKNICLDSYEKAIKKCLYEVLVYQRKS